MSKRNFTLLLIVVAVIVGLALLFLFLQKPKTISPTGDSGDNNFIANFNPFGNSKNVPPETNKTPEENTEENTNNQTTIDGLRITKVSSMPVAGFGVYMKEIYKVVPEVIPQIPFEPVVPTPDTTKKNTKVKTAPLPPAPATEFIPAVRYVDKATGNIYQTEAETIQERKFSSTIIPRIHEAYFGDNSQSVIMRYLKSDDSTIETFVGTLPKELLGGDTSDTNEVKGVFLPQNITDLSVSGDSKNIFYVFNSGADTIGINTDAFGIKKTQIFNSAYNEWLTNYPNTNTITLTTKPSSDVPGYVFALDQSNGLTTKIIGGINGLTTLTSPNGKLVLYGDSKLGMGIYDRETRTSAPISLVGMPEKCTWAKTNDFIYCASPKGIPTGNYPDSWYKGNVSFSDSFWQIDVATGNTNFLLDPISINGGEDVDGIKLDLDETENYLFFVNKKDSFLWQIKLR